MRLQTDWLRVKQRAGSTVVAAGQRGRRRPPPLGLKQKGAPVACPQRGIGNEGVQVGKRTKASKLKLNGASRFPELPWVFMMDSKTVSKRNSLEHFGRNSLLASPGAGVNQLLAPLLKFVGKYQSYTKSVRHSVPDAWRQHFPSEGTACGSPVCVGVPTSSWCQSSSWCSAIPEPDSSHTAEGPSEYANTITRGNHEGQQVFQQVWTYRWPERLVPDSLDVAARLFVDAFMSRVHLSSAGPCRLACQGGRPVGNDSPWSRSRNPGFLGDAKVTMLMGNNPGVAMGDFKLVYTHKGFKPDAAQSCSTGALIRTRFPIIRRYNDTFLLREPLLPKHGGHFVERQMITDRYAEKGRQKFRKQDGAFLLSIPTSPYLSTGYSACVLGTGANGDRTEALCMDRKILIVLAIYA
ncbi:hypothetical protein FA13DRAFT_1707427 [Coprinellus micaceus]|uniref:Uncharacterized protein n=1 Tax=Coprinellus micaceus TaxID=71717 RepID=A0A4Y7TK23_COPMI|nr:hypothetical protein FA13DRAFT_1707427 [Coprinellus micaceus]